jgi:hypothetical protein
MMKLLTWSTAIVVMAVAPIAAQNRDITADVEKREAILDHIDVAEDIVESLLDWRHVLIGKDSTSIVGPSTTLISIEREPVTKLAGALDAIWSMLPPRADGAATGPHGDLRAHVEKAREITRELMPNGASSAVGTSGTAVQKGPTQTGDIVTVDRTALQRLEVEIDAIERVAPRALRRK